MRVLVGDVRLFFDVDGEGLVVAGRAMRDRPVLILLSGGPGFDHTVFKPGYAQLADVTQTIYLDLRGHGRSDRGDPSRWTLDVWAEDLREFCTVLGIDRPIVLGWSFGGMVAMAYAIRFPQHPSKLILQSTRPRLNLDGLVEAFRKLGGEQAATAARAYWSTGGAEALAEYGAVCAPLYGSGPVDPDEIARMTLNLELLAHPGPAVRDVNLLPGLATVTCPTLVVAGDLDPWGSVAAAAEIVSALPSHLCRYEQFAGAGHHIHHDQPQRLFALLREFITGPAVISPSTLGRATPTLPMTVPTWTRRRTLPAGTRPKQEEQHVANGIRDDGATSTAQ